MASYQNQPWSVLELSDEQTARLEEVERMCSCPILSAAPAAASVKSLTTESSEKGTLREWYIECAIDPPKEEPLVKATINKVIL
jgi:hypothetical protein